MAAPPTDDPFPLARLLAVSERLQRPFFARPVIETARECLGKILVHGRTAGRIVEVEAYLGEQDRAAHAWRGRTRRTQVLYGPAGHAYVYFIYGMYECLNFTAESEGSPGTLLVRALEPLSGLALMRRRRGPAARRVEDLASGPGKLTLAMGITRRHNESDLVTGPIQVRRLTDEPPFEIAVTPRIGIRHCVDWPLRFVIAGNRFASKGR
ncbi:MAG TPA: DNA-3-methyladenine glycosylase [Bryobacteraceae bacterium]|nr:DNA-3-methyladenine glycosylase [Bryobacteraceae bacterium]